MRWVRLHILAEGDAEENFANDMLKKHLYQFNIDSYVQRIAKKLVNQGKHEKGGLTNYRRAKQHIVLLMNEQRAPNCYFTTMFDIYHMPSDPDKCFPGYEEAQKQLIKGDYHEALKILSDSMIEDLKADVSGISRLLPYFQLHEFEALLFTDLIKLQEAYPKKLTEDKLAILNKALIEADGDPEKVNHENGPAKRIKEQIPGYNKAVIGPMILENIGLEELRKCCNHFNSWLEKLESLKFS